MKYKLKEVQDKIYAVIVNDKYDLAMLFCRVQEFYESPNRKIRNKKFSIWDYQRWYSKNYFGCFSYPKDWSGFNLPVKIALNCYKKNKLESPYDNLFTSILKKVDKNGYLIGIDKIGTSIYFHELCHGLYYTNFRYKNEMDSLTESLSKNTRNKFANNLVSKGYCKNVIDDEIQAYSATECNSAISKGITNIKKIHKQYKNVLESFIY